MAIEEDFGIFFWIPNGKYPRLLLGFEVGEIVRKQGAD